MSIKYANPPPTPPEALHKVAKPTTHYTDHLKAPMPKAVVETALKGEGVVKTKEEEVQLPVGPPIPLSELVQVNVGGSHTVNLGNYESAKISVSITVPCRKGEHDDAYDFATTWVSDKITAVVKEIKKAKG